MISDTYNDILCQHEIYIGWHSLKALIQYIGETLFSTVNPATIKVKLTMTEWRLELTTLQSGV